LPRIGLLSDSHGRAATTRAAVQLLLSHQPDVLIHLGDVGSVEVIDALLGESASGDLLPVHVVFGNTDWDAADLGRYARRLGVQVDDPVGRLTLEDGGELWFMHGHDARAMARALARQVRYLCHGHTHQPADHRRGTTRIINPGALFRAQRYTVAVLDTAQDELAFHPVEPAW
jgi:uncharacterized protein